MDFSWTEEQLELFEAIEKFSRGALNDNLIEADRNGVFNADGWKQCADLGIHGLCVPEELGGLGLDAVTTMAALERMGYGCRDNGLSFSLNAQMWTVTMPLVDYGSEELKARYLPGLCDGSIIGANGTSEPGSGSDAYSMTTTAVKDGDHYVLNGSKIWVTNAPVADVTAVYATVNRERGVHGITAFLVDRDTPGFSTGKPIEKMGLRTSPMAEVFLDDCRVPESHRLGPEGAGSFLFTHSMNYERGSILASGVGSMQHTLERCIAYAKERKQFGRPIGQFQSVANRIVDMKLALETSRDMLYHSAWRRDQNKRAIMEAAMAKLHISECWVKTTEAAIQVFGGAGYTVEYELERELRDAMASRLYSGTSDIQRNLIASMLGVS